MEHLTSRTVFHDIELKSGERDEFDGAAILPDSEWEESAHVTPEPDLAVLHVDSDEEWDTDLEDEGKAPPHKYISEDQARQVYLAACRQLGIVPATCFVRGIDTDTLNLSYQGLGPLGTRAVATGLVMDRVSSRLLLAGNFIGTDGIRHVGEMLKENEYLTYVDLSENDLETYAAEVIAGVFKENDNIIALKLSGNQFKDKDAEHFAAILTIGQYTGLKKLDMSHNNFGDIGAEILGKAIDSNETLQELNLAWNQIRRSGIHHLAKGLAENNSLRVFNLSGNGVDNAGAECLGRALTSNRYLTDLSLNSNRIGLEGVAMLFTSIGKNEALKIIRLTNNPITIQGPMAALTLIQKSETSVLEQIEIADACVPREFYAMLEDVQRARPLFTVHIGGFMNSRDMCKVAEKKAQEGWAKDPVLVFVHFIESRNIKVLDLFKQVDTDKSCTLSKQELVSCLGKLDCPLNEKQLSHLIDVFDVDNSGEIDVEEFIDGFARHKRRFSKYANGSSGSRGSSATSASSSRPPSQPVNTPDSTVKRSRLMEEKLHTLLVPENKNLLDVPLLRTNPEVTSDELPGNFILPIPRAATVS
ncbi:leucine-rich repeat-containing protein 74B-like isoform X2 [Dreissena polymorpha]|uniref:leucine-rich repeat-containing protein 74B-like isoform X2 n=1 Tax=Dreissena polymorpha TaxID=45954 RepID=UPI00226557D9|nr:leucine-rich repeat-containing protein 74B-like isoform X2 [Dreissena polymorpha]